MWSLLNHLLPLDGYSLRPLRCRRTLPANLIIISVHLRCTLGQRKLLGIELGTCHSLGCGLLFLCSYNLLPLGLRPASRSPLRAGWVEWVICVRPCQTRTNTRLRAQCKLNTIRLHPYPLPPGGESKIAAV